jgi:hypothetical protein
VSVRQLLRFQCVSCSLNGIFRGSNDKKFISEHLIDVGNNETWPFAILPSYQIPECESVYQSLLLTKTHFAMILVLQIASLKSFGTRVGLHFFDSLVNNKVIIDCLPSRVITVSV